MKISKNSRSSSSILVEVPILNLKTLPSRSFSIRQNNLNWVSSGRRSLNLENSKIHNASVSERSGPSIFLTNPTQISGKNRYNSPITPPTNPSSNSNSPQNYSKGFELVYHLFPLKNPNFSQVRIKRRPTKLDCNFEKQNEEFSSIGHHSNVVKKALKKITIEPIISPGAPKHDIQPIDFSRKIKRVDEKSDIEKIMESVYPLKRSKHIYNY
ncbi:unnamed protein product [Blepharisma stoltei]|uniref:Uncharacterized protein n=1 Tax=Blepharisma stoltei TaxID=1481888 RepID=A0AAU9IRZ1_9CILI|nr:unnamed protein product [Blepharisma stoltei]